MNQPSPPAPIETSADRQPGEITELWRRAARVPWWLRVIALGKLAKAIGFLILGLAAAKVARFGVEDTVALWLTWVHMDPDQGHTSQMLELLKMAKPETLKHFGLGFFIYAGVLVIEAFGLWFDRAWAEWLVIGVASALIPFEVFEIIAHPTAARVSALFINLIIVAALSWRLKAKHVAKAAATTAVS